MTRPLTLIGLTVILHPTDYLKSARLGGLMLPLNPGIIDHPCFPTEQADKAVEKGMLHAIGESFERHYPSRYPEDCDLLVDPMTGALKW
jgi:hypothetical protein